MSADLVLAKMDRALLALAEAKDVMAIQQVIAMADAARVYDKHVGASVEMVNRALEIRLRAERRLGEMLQASPKNVGAKNKGPGRGKKGGSRMIPPFDETPTLAEAGISKRLSSHAQQLSTMPAEEFEAALVVPDGQELNQSKVTRVLKERKREKVRKKNRELVESTAPVIVRAADTKYQTIVIDPPWDWGDEGDADQFGRARPTYDTMSLAQIADLPVGELAEKNAHLYLWITNRSLPKGFQLLERWGFRYVTALTWCKPSIGMGNYYRGSTEHVLFAVKGSLPLLRNDVGTWFAANRAKKHSGKPESFFDLVEQCSPGPWLEMFARRERRGWASWGAEA